MIEPFQSGDAFLADVHDNNTAGCLRLWWLGQSGFLVQWDGEHLLLDPYLSDSLTRKYAATDKPHVRMTRRVVAPERLSFINVVTSSHNHTDHLDAETILPLLRANSGIQLVIPEANREFVAARLACDTEWLLGLDDGLSVQCGAFTLAGIPAAHEELKTDDQGRHHFLGYIIRCGPWTLYHSGDTLWYEGMEKHLQPFAIDVALLPINGKKPSRRVAGNLSGVEAARLAHAIGATTAIPCHYDMFLFNTATPDDFVAEAKKLEQPYRVLQNGEGWSPGFRTFSP